MVEKDSQEFVIACQGMMNKDAIMSTYEQSRCNINRCGGDYSASKGKFRLANKVKPGINI